MDIKIVEIKGVKVAQIDSQLQLINSVDDALNLIGNVGYLGAQKVILHQNNLSADFFNLKTRFAGDVLQKFSNYAMQLAIVGDFKRFSSGALQDFIYESNKAGQVLFVETQEDAEIKLIHRTV